LTTARQSLFRASARNPALYPASREQLLDAYRSYLNQMKAKLPELFATLPKAGLIVEATPAYTERQRPSATYEPGPIDGTRPGRVVVNTYNFAGISLGDVESIAYHEGIPGHHLQFSIAQERVDLPDFRMHREYTAYTEGWGPLCRAARQGGGFLSGSPQRLRPPPKRHVASHPSGRRYGASLQTLDTTAGG
jgi:uncharacterized protein (DUF885 family)